VGGVQGLSIGGKSLFNMGHDRNLCELIGETGEREPKNRTGSTS